MTTKFMRDKNFKCHTIHLAFYFFCDPCKNFYPSIKYTCGITAINMYVYNALINIGF